LSVSGSDLIGIEYYLGYPGEDAEAEAPQQFLEVAAAAADRCKGR